MTFEDYSDTGKEVDYHLKADVKLNCSLVASERYSLIFPRGVTRIRVNDGTQEGSHLFMSSSKFALSSPSNALNLEALSIYGRIAVLQPSASRWEEHERDNLLSERSKKSLRQIGTRCFQLTKWLDELVDRYDFERRLNSRTPAQCPLFVEKQILNEVIRIVCPEEVPTTGELVGTQQNSALHRVLKWIDDNIFQDIDAESIAQAMNSSVSQSNKFFQAELNTTPLSYVAELRLEYAARFLERGELRPSDLATMCGFSELSAFSRAFKRKFGVAPSDYRLSKLR